MAPIPWKTTNKTLSFTDCVLITNASKAQDAAWSLVKYLTGKEGSWPTARPPAARRPAPIRSTPGST
jgi:ABC-type glycerol-3-phosphate transport system substrate-binding protein